MEEIKLKKIKIKIQVLDSVRLRRKDMGLGLVWSQFEACAGLKLDCAGLCRTGEL